MNSQVRDAVYESLDFETVQDSYKAIEMQQTQEKEINEQVRRDMSLEQSTECSILSRGKPKRQGKGNISIKRSCGVSYIKASESV